MIFKNKRIAVLWGAIDKNWSMLKGDSQMIQPVAEYQKFIGTLSITADIGLTATMWLAYRKYLPKPYVYIFEDENYDLAAIKAMLSVRERQQVSLVSDSDILDTDTSIRGLDAFFHRRLSYRKPKPIFLCLSGQKLLDVKQYVSSAYFCRIDHAFEDGQSAFPKELYRDVFAKRTIIDPEDKQAIEDLQMVKKHTKFEQLDNGITLVTKVKASPGKLGHYPWRYERYS